eukprot:TRINITY_DN5698_c0_g1_i2.p2 TRINITY_DN5698_c0_g1~~TRINITY_DN5698_c0_g1_i2.p2  ORF type:complete len:265 (+),score=24.30 TRINITY_DN5698_c0_g1_i2:235-1029(+)
MGKAVKDIDMSQQLSFHQEVCSFNKNINQFGTKDMPRYIFHYAGKSGELSVPQTCANMQREITRSFRVPQQRLDPCLKSPKCAPRRVKSLRRMPTVQPVEPKKVVLKAQKGVLIINGEQEPTLIPKLDLKNLKCAQTCTPRLPIARRGVLQHNDEVFQLMIHHGFQKPQLSSKKLIQRVSSEASDAGDGESVASSFSSFDVPEEYVPTHRPLQKCKTCDNDDVSEVDNIIEKFSQIRAQSLDSTPGHLSNLRQLAQSFANQDLE